MIGLMLAAALGAQAAPSGDWVVVDVQRVIAPETTRGQCFVQGQVRRVVRGEAYLPGQNVAIALACTAGRRQLMIPLAAEPGAIRRPPITVQRLEATKRALVHLDRQGRVIGNEYYAVGPQPVAPR
jgi:hypothetical protein